MTLAAVAGTSRISSNHRILTRSRWTAQGRPFATPGDALYGYGMLSTLRGHSLALSSCLALALAACASDDLAVSGAESGSGAGTTSDGTTTGPSPSTTSTSMTTMMSNSGNSDTDTSTSTPAPTPDNPATPDGSAGPP